MLIQSRFSILSSLLVALVAQPALAQQPVDDPDQLVTKVYRVADLVMPAPNYAFRGIFLPGFQGSNPYGSDAGRSGTPGLNMPGIGGYGGGGGMGGGMGGGGGFFAVPDETLSRAVASPVTQSQSVIVSKEGQVLAQQAAPGQQPSHGGAGGFGGAMSPAMAGQSPQLSGSLRFSLGDLISAIQTTVEPRSWDTVGGSGSIFPLGGMLLISQTRTVHNQIQELLTALRTEGAALRSVTVEAHWLLVNNDELKSLSPGGITAGAAIDRDGLTKLVENKQVYRAQVTCFDGQSVHVLSGNVKSMVSSLIPVVGQIENDGAEVEQLVTVPDRERRTAKVLTAVQRSASSVAKIQTVQAVQTPRNVGYQPVLTMVNLGALLQVTPMLSDNSVVLDLQSIVVSGAADVKAIEFKGLVSLDKVDVVTQQLMTTLRIPVGQPTLAGGMTMQPGSGDAGENQLYLVVEATLPSDLPVAEKKPARAKGDVKN